MDAAKKARLASRGYHETTVTEFLGLTPEDEAWIEMKLALTQRLRESRKASGATQAELAHRIGSGQSRVAKMEAGNPNVSFDLLIRSLLAIGATPAEIGRQIAAVPYPDQPSKKSPPSRAPRTRTVPAKPASKIRRTKPVAA